MLKNNKATHALVLIVLSGFIASLAYSFSFRVPPYVDAKAYDAIAWHLASGAGYRESLAVPLADDLSAFRLGPGYEWFLAGLYRSFGHRPEPAWIAQALLHAATALLAYLLARRLFLDAWSPGIGLVAAGLVAFSPDLITMSAMLMTETLAIFLTTAAVVLFFQYDARPSLKRLIAFATALAAATLTRAPAIFFLIPLAVYLWRRKRLMHSLLLLATLAVLFTPWTVRNYRAYGLAAPTNAASGYNLLTGNHPGATGEQESSSVVEDLKNSYGVVAADGKARDLALRDIAADPGAFALRTLRRASIYLSLARPTGFWFHLSGASKIITLALSGIMTAILFLGAALGIGNLSRLSGGDRGRALLLLGLAAMLPLSIVFIVVETRYRLPVYPLLAVFAGAGIVAVKQKTLAFRPAILAAFLVLLVTAADVLLNVGRILARIRGL